MHCSEMDEDISRLKTTAVSLLSDLGCNGQTLTEDLISEMCRFGAAELHAVAAFIGGVASQEVIKVASSSLFTIASLVNLLMSSAPNSLGYYSPLLLVIYRNRDAIFCFKATFSVCCSS